MRNSVPFLLLVFSLAASSAAAFDRFEIFAVEDGNIMERCFARTTFDSGNGELHLVIPVRLSPALGGISGAEFYLQGLENLPAGWSAQWDAIPASVTLGNFLGPGQEGRRGGAIAIDPSGAGCGGQNEGELYLIRVDLRAIGAEQDLPQTILRIVAADPPFLPYLACPMVTLCDAPAYTARCAEGAGFYINPEPQVPPANPRPGDGAIDVPQDVTLEWDAPHVPWVCTNGTFEEHVQFGTTPDPPLVGMPCGVGLFHPPPGRLAPETTYYWRVCADTDMDGACGPVWSFTTAKFVGVSTRSWSQVKQVYR